MRAGRTLVALCAVFALASAIYFVFEYESPVYAGPTLGAVSLALAILQLAYRYWTGHARPRGEPPAPEQLDAAADWLAAAIADSWRKEAVARRITIPDPVPVRWKWSGGLSPREAGSPPFPGSGPSALPGPEPPGCIPASGVVTELHNELYRRLLRGRLVITGEPGSGKTAAMILLLLEDLAWREKLGDDERPDVPVPVLLTLGGWDPASVPLSAWAASVLNRDYHALRSPRYGGDAASALISSGRVALFLDGLDEMPEKLRTAAMRQLSTEAPRLRIVMTSRPEEYADAIRRAPLDGSAAIVLCPVPPAEAARFLLHQPLAHNRAAWRKVASYIKANPGSAAAKALGSPLTLTMARDAYTSGSPAEIINSPSSQVEDKITGQLIDQFVPGQRARHWLGYLARHLNGQSDGGSRDLEWWRLGGMLHTATRVLAITLATAIVGTLVDWIIGLPVSQITRFPPHLAYTAPDRLRLTLSEGILIGSIFGITFGLAYAVAVAVGKATFKPSQVPLRLRGPRAMAGALFRGRNHSALAAWGFLGGFAAEVCYVIISVLAESVAGVRVLSVAAIHETVILMAYNGLMLGLAAAIPCFIISVLKDPSGTGAAATPLGLLAQNRSRALFQTAILAPLPMIIIAAGDWIIAGPLQETLLQGPLVIIPVSWLNGLANGAVVGIGGTISYILAFTAWGQWLLLARIVLPLTGRLPWKLTGFLQDAYDRGILRQAGAVYEFRHHTLQTYLSQQRAGTG